MTNTKTKNINKKEVKENETKKKQVFYKISAELRAKILMFLSTRTIGEKFTVQAGNQNIIFRIKDISNELEAVKLCSEK